MKRINPHNCDDMSVYEDITQSIKNKNTKKIFLDIKPKIEGRLRKYVNNKHKLENVQKIEWEEDKATVMRSLALNRAKFGLVRKKVKENNENGKCLYCDLNEDDSLDHHMPKNIFPEYSIFSLNLVPSCSKCNRMKSTVWLDDKGNRSFINPYFDKINNKELLKCEIFFTRENPYPKFFIDSSNNKVVSIMKNHTTTLNLLKRYERESNHVITDYVYKGENWKNKVGAEYFRKGLEQDFVQSKKRFGLNYWKAALLKAMLENKDFIDFCLKKQQSKID